MGTPAVGWLTIHLMIPGCTSLKEKRSHIKPLLSRLHKEFNVSTAEVDHQDVWQETVITCAAVSSDRVQTQRLLQQVAAYIESHFPDLPLLDQQMEII